MLNISINSISQYIDRSDYKSFNSLKQRRNSKLLLKILLLLFVIMIISMFLPWTQNIRSNGYVTTLNPYDKPQNIQALIGGRIDKWYVTEGDIVQVGDTIAVLAEAKAEYLDPEILLNTKDQQMAKLRSADAYQTKRNFLLDQINSLDENLNTRLKQVMIEQEQNTLEMESTQQELLAAKTYAENASNQLNRMTEMYNKGIKSLTDLESKKLSNREAQAKLLSIENKLNKLKNESVRLSQELDVLNTDYQQKKAKLESEIRSADSYRYSLLGESSKLASKFNELKERQNSFIITSPVSGRITKVLKNGIGEYIKEKESIASIVPLDYQKAVELYIEPNDMPLVDIGNEVRLQFDGWPAIVFSGWPENSFGTFPGVIYAIDNDISENGKYRILVVEDRTEKEWPELIRIGSGARGLLLLKDVRVYYELWRKLNGFPPDFYDQKKIESIKNKVPLRKIK